MLLYPKDILEKLEFDKVVELIKKECLGGDAKLAFDQIQFETNKDSIERNLDLVTEFSVASEKGHRIPLTQYENIDEEIYLLSKENYVLEVESIQSLYKTIVTGHEISFFFKDFQKQKQYPLLFEICETITIDNSLSNEINRVLDSEGNIKPDASPNLLKISKSISNKERELEKIFGQELARLQKQNLLVENAESVRNGRRVLTVAAENKRQINGVMHDESSTGKMVYIEPEATIIINNEIFSLHTERRKEIYKIIRDLCNFLRPYRHDLEHAYRVIVKLDILRAKSIFSKSINGVKPTIVSKPKISLIEAKNPILKLKLEKQEQEVIPFTLDLHGPNRLLVLSGPNAGGKSVTMKTTGLLQLMTQAGIPISASEESRVGIFKKIFVDIGDQQSLEDDLSTYSSHLQNMKKILDEVDKDSLILIDEFGSGTDPKIGGAIAEAILHEINHTKAYGVITTHYSNLKFYAFKMKGVVNGSMEFDKNGLKPTFQLSVGKPGSSFAFEIASKTGLPDRVIKNARKKTGKNENALEDMLVELQTERREIESKMSVLLNKEEKIDELIKNYNTLHNELEYQRKKLKLDRKQAHLYQSSTEIKELKNLIKELKKSQDLEKAKDKLKEVTSKNDTLKETVDNIKSEVFESVKVHEGDIKEGVFARVRNSESVGKVISIDKNTVELEVGFLKIFVDKKDLIPSKEPIQINRKKSVDTSMVSGIGGQVETKLDLRGYKVDDAMWFLEEFMDRAVMNNAYELKIIHGVGNGTLRKHVLKKLKEYKEINKVWHPEEEFGGLGVTLVQI